MPSSGMLRRIALLRTDVSVAYIIYIIRVTRIGELGTMLPLATNRRTLRRNAKFSDSCHPDDGDAKFLRFVGSYKSHTV
jgi:hypothetical protein